MSQATSQVSQTKDDSYIFQQLTSETPNWAAYLGSNRFKAVVRIISIEREYGCGAAKIGQKLAEHLGWDLWDQRLTQEIARLAQSTESAIEQREERCDPLYHRLLKSFALGSYEGNLGVYPIQSTTALRSPPMACARLRCLACRPLQTGLALRVHCLHRCLMSGHRTTGLGSTTRLPCNVLG